MRSNINLFIVFAFSSLISIKNTSDKDNIVTTNCDKTRGAAYVAPFFGS